jgi:hypothetical protein
MSKISLAPDASGTGIFTIASPNSDTNRTLTLPDDTGTIDRLNRAGNVLQVVQTSQSTEITTSSTSYVDTGLTASITPTNASNKILVVVLQNGIIKQTADTTLSLQLLRDATQIALSTGNAWNGTTDGNQIGAVGWTILDSPNTTSSVTYKTQYANRTGSGTVGVQWQFGGSNTSTITLMEIAG